MDWTKTTARQNEKHLSLGIWFTLYKRFYGSSNSCISFEMVLLKWNTFDIFYYKIQTPLLCFPHIQWVYLELWAPLKGQSGRLDPGKPNDWWQELNNTRLFSLGYWDQTFPSSENRLQKCEVNNIYVDFSFDVNGFQEMGTIKIS